MSNLIRFIRDVSSHQLEVIRDDGLYRHLRFSRPNTNAYYFDIVTWPGYLTVTGDMGTWTFSRIADMFQFFAAERQSFEVNPGYWSEKFESGTGRSRHDTPCYEFDGDAFDKGIREWLESYLADCEDEDDADTAKEAVRELTGNGFRDEKDAYYALNDAFLPHNVSSYDISEGMGSNMKYSHHYLWICYAIVWGIERYNNIKLVSKAMDTFLNFLPVHAAIREVHHG
ncbi:hypothetical protein IBT47_10525 [Erwinia sp. S43]|uniref:hypothetical protein n=1 Tax=Erwinia sp. S43 TaxID=2769339 RepID=UPI00190A0740|nr:hypothetical protein [Erwinia sp. S43]MBK0032717.1 hypothetical protein [Erwinia sp. S43]